MTKSKNVLWWLLLVLCAGVAIFAAVRLGGQYFAYRAADQEYAQLSELAYLAPGDEEGGQNAGITEGDEQEPYVSPINFAALQEINPDIVAWVSVEGTDIDYPVLSGEDNDYYLHHTFNGTANGSGAIFMDYRNSSDFSDYHTIVYGHQMRDGSMFAGLSAYKDQAFYDEYPTFVLYTPESELRCAIISAYVTDAVSDTYTLDFSDRGEFIDYLGLIIGQSLIVPERVEGNVEHVITLSTCDYTYDDARMVVHGVPIQD